MPFLALCTILPVAMSLRAQRPKDPLTAEQEEQVRDVADQPNERVKLYMKFIEQRTDAIAQTVKHPATQHPSADVHDALEAYTSLVDELEDNLDAYDESHLDIRKSLRLLLDHAAKWPAILQQPAASPQYDFARKSALDATASLKDVSTSLLKSQQEYFAVHKPPKE